MNQSAVKLVFISYSHDSPSHKEWVLLLANRLRRDGIYALIDRYVAAPLEGWPRWIQRQIEDSDYTILICTEVYKRRFEGHEVGGIGKGVTWEGLIANQILYDNSSRNRVFIPVIPPNGKVDDIPTALRPFSFYQLDSEYDALYRHIMGVSEVVPYPLPQYAQSVARHNFVQSDGLPAEPPPLDTLSKKVPDGDTCFSMELLSPLNCQVLHSGVISTKYGPESPTWTVRIMEERKLFNRDGEVRELQPFLVLVESRTKETLSLVANTRIWIRNPVNTATTVSVNDRIGTILIPKDNTKHPPFTFSRGATYEGILKYRPRIYDRFWRAIGSARKRDKFDIIEHHAEKDSGVTYVVAPSAGIFESSADFHYLPGQAIKPNECLGFISRGNMHYDIRSIHSGILLSTMARVNEAVHAGQRLFRMRVGPPSLYLTMMPSEAENPCWYEVYSPISGKFHLEESKLQGVAVFPGLRFERKKALCNIEAGDIYVHIGLDLDGTIMEIPPMTNQEVHFGQLLMVVCAERVLIRSFIAGNFYRASSPGEEPFVTEGSKVETGNTLCIIEALKLENRIESEVTGVIVKILVENGQTVEYGQSLFVIDLQK